LKIKGLGETNLKLCRQFYQIYPQFLELLSFKNNQNISTEIRQLLTDQFYIADNQHQTIRQLATDEFDTQSVTEEDLHYSAMIFQSISFTHFAELIKIEDSIKRKFYEWLILKTQASVSELKRSMASLSFERLGLAADYEIASKQISTKIQPQQATDIVKSHYFFEFLDINHPHLIEETELEQALVAHLQQFILELGNGFCFEARQKRLMIDSDYYFVDLVFYHRILKCHVLIELKTDKFKHEYLSQLNTYVAYFNDRERMHDDNPSVGILLCADKGEQLVKYAMAGMNQQLFVSKYQLQLPAKEELIAFIQKELKNLNYE
jgi:predicted nuclease of restriction endonuclease-like (RecB) superfamily